MSLQVGVWQIVEGQPLRARRSRVDLEAQLEDWIAADVSLLAEGLTVVGRQLHLEAGYLDLLCIDVRGAWVVVELKRGRLHREVVAQALDYAACVASLSAEELRAKVADGLARLTTAAGVMDAVDRQLESEADGGRRDVSIIVSGSGFDAGLERVLGLLTGHDLPISAITFDVMEMADGAQLLVREILEEEAPEVSVPRPRQSVADISAVAARAGVQRAFDLIIEAAEAAGLHARPYTRSVMIAPSSHKNRFLMVLTPDGRRGLRINHGPDAFAEFFPHLDPQMVIDALGPGGDRWFAGTAADQQAQAIGVFLATLNVNEET